MKLSRPMIDGLRRIAAGRSRPAGVAAGWINTVQALKSRGLVSQVGQIRPKLILTPEGEKELEKWPE